MCRVKEDDGAVAAHSVPPEHERPEWPSTRMALSDLPMKRRVVINDADRDDV